MKRTLSLCLLMALTCFCRAQYDAAVRYRTTSPSFYAAMDTLIARAADPIDTSCSDLW